MTISNRKMNAQNFDTIHDILRYLSLAQFLLKARNGNRGVNGKNILVFQTYNATAVGFDHFSIEMVEFRLCKLACQRGRAANEKCILSDLKI